MKTLQVYIRKRCDRLNDHWRRLSLKQQRQYTLYVFLGYLALTLIVLTKVCLDIGASGNTITIRHIENPILKHQKASAAAEDSISNLKK